MVLFLMLPAAVQGQFWEHTYGGYGSDRLAQVAALDDGTFVVVGSTGSFGPGGGDAYILHLDASGGILASTVLGDIGVDAACGVACKGPFFAVAGIGTDPITGDYAITITGMEAGAGVLWTRSYGTTDWDLGVAVAALPAGWAVLGHSYATGAGDARILLIDDAGDEQAAMTWGGPDDDVPSAIRADDLGQLFVAGTREAQVRDVAFLLKLDASLNEAWSVELPSDSSERAHGLCLLANGDVLLVGSTREASAELRMFLARFSPQGALLWKEVVGQVDDFEAFDAVQRPDDGLAVIGYTKAFGQGGRDMYLLLTDAGGAFEQGLTFGSAANEDGRSICLTPDGYLFGGTTEGYGPGPAAFHVIRTNAAGSTEGAPVLPVFDPVGMAEPPVAPSPVYPVPVASGGELRLREDVTKATGWWLSDAAGRPVSSGDLDPTDRTLHIGLLREGVYVLHLSGGSGPEQVFRIPVVGAR